MNMYKKTLVAFGLTLLAFEACHGMEQFNQLKSQLNNSFTNLFTPKAPDTFGLTTLKNNERIPMKLANFNTAIKNIVEFVQTNNRGRLLQASANLTEANNVLIMEATKLITMLGEMRNRLQATNNFATGLFNSQTGARSFYTDLGNIQDRIREIRNILRPKVDDYKSTGQKESYALLMDALQNIYDAAAIVRDQLQPHLK